MNQPPGDVAGQGGESSGRIAGVATPDELVVRSAAVLFRIDPATLQVLQVSANIETVLGYRAAELVGHADLWSRIRPGGCERAQETLAAALKDRRGGFTVPLRVANRAGVLRDVVVSGRLHYDARGAPTDVICALVDLTTEMRASEAALDMARREQKMAARMRAVAEAALGVVTVESTAALEAVLRRAAQRVLEFDSFMLAVYDPTTDSLEFMPGFDAGVTGAGAKIPVAGTPSERVIRERRSLVTARASDPRAQGAIAFGTMRRSESVVRTPIVSGNAVRGMLSVQSYTPARYDAQDVHVLEALAATAASALAHIDALRERAAVEAERERVLSIIEASGDFVAAVNRDQRTLYVNRGGRALLGIPAEEPLDRVHFSAFTTADGFETLRKRAIPHAVRHGTWSGDASLLTRSREEIPVHQTITAHFRPDGELSFLSTIARDLRPHRRLEQQLRQAQKMEAIGRLAGGIAHDFNNLLTAVTGHSALLLDALDPSNPLRAEAVEIGRAAERAASLTRQLLAFSRQQVLRPVPMELNAAIEEMSSMLQRLIGADVVLRTQLTPGLGLVHADPAQIQQVVLNLVINARDAMPAGGAVVVATQDALLPREDLPFPPGARPGRYNVLTVSDSGVGMDAETMSRIFEPFFTTKEQGKGTGLGLPTVYGIVEQSAGFVDVESRPGVGTVFRVFLPHSGEQAAAGAQRAAEPPIEAARPASDITILLAEDDAAVRALARRVLVREGYNVLEAKDGKEALRVAAAFGGQIDVLLTDVVMPETGGPELARRLTADRPDVKVVYTSGYTQDEAVRHGILAAVPFLPKPFAPAALVRVIRQALRGDAPARQPRP